MTIHPDNVRPGWDDYWMLMAVMAALRSPDPSTKVGAVLVTPDNRQLGMGYNGPPRGIDIWDMPWERDGEPQNTKYPYVVHAEANCLTQASSTQGGVMYCTLYPCPECAKLCIQHGVSEIRYLEDKYHDTWQGEVARDLLFKAELPAYRHKIHPDAVTILQNQLFKLKQEGD